MLCRKSALSSGPIVATMEVYDDFYFYGYGVYQRISNIKQDDHAIEIIGFRDYDPNNIWGGGYFICKNSWGNNWGAKIVDYECKARDGENLDGGYFCIAYNQIDETIGVNFAQVALLYKNLIIPPHYSISGNILSNNYSVANLDIYLKYYANNNNKWFEVNKIQSNSGGSYKFDYVLSWDYRVEPEKYDWCFNPQYQDINLNNNIENLNFSIGYSIFGSTKIGFTNKPISNVKVFLSGPSPGNIFTDSYGNFNFSERLCGDYTITLYKENCFFSASPYSFNLSYSNINLPTFYCLLKTSGKLGPLYPSNSTVSVSGIATNGEVINQTTNVDSYGYFTFYLPEGNYKFTPLGECIAYNPPFLQKDIIYGEVYLLNFISSSWKVCSSCYPTLFDEQFKCSKLLENQEECYQNAFNNFKICAYNKTMDANSYLYNAVILSIQVHRAKGQPEEEKENFIVEEDGDYFINVTNGDYFNNETTVSSAEINLNGIGQIFGPQDFNKNVFQLKKQIHLTEGEYQISTILRSKPGSYLTIVISNKDISSFPDLP